MDHQLQSFEAVVQLHGCLLGRLHFCPVPLVKTQRKWQVGLGFLSIHPFLWVFTNPQFFVEFLNVLFLFSMMFKIRVALALEMISCLGAICSMILPSNYSKSKFAMDTPSNRQRSCLLICCRWSVIFLFSCRLHTVHWLNNMFPKRAKRRETDSRMRVFWAPLFCLVWAASGLSEEHGRATCGHVMSAGIHKEPLRCRWDYSFFLAESKVWALDFPKKGELGEMWTPQRVRHLRS